MTNTDSSDQERSGGLDVQFAQELIDRGRAEGVSLVGPGGLLAGVTKTVLQPALEAEMTDHLGYEKGSARFLRAATTATAPRPRRC